ncbi:MAG TPA: VCBS repeat-containing protein [Nitrospiria bacterium]|jgi:hypothetical protein
MKINSLKKIYLLALSAFFFGACGGGGNGDGGGNPGPNPIFQAAVTYVTGAKPEAVTSGDFDGDGNQDIAVANDVGDSVTILLGDGDGPFSSSVTVPLAIANSCPVAIARGNFLGDNIDDIAVVSFSTDKVSIINGDGNRNFIENNTFSVGSAPQGISVADFDGKLGDDIAVVNFGEDTVSVLLGNDIGTFAPQPKIQSENFKGPFGITAGDFNSISNTLVDLAVVNQANNSVVNLIGSDTVRGSFTPSSSDPVGNSPSAIASGDFDNDGKLDVVVANTQDIPDPTVSILWGDGNGSFSSPTKEFTMGKPFSVDTGDLDQDGNLDIAVANQGDNSISILMGRGDRTFEPQKTFPTETAPSSVILRDFNKDGKLDMAVANSGSDTVSVFLNGL